VPAEVSNVMESDPSATQEQPDLFVSGRLFYAKSIKESADERFLSFGFQAALNPFQAMSPALIEAARGEYEDECAASGVACPSFDTVVGVVGANAEKFKQAADAASADPSGLIAQLKAAGVPLTAEQEQAIGEGIKSPEALQAVSVLADAAKNPEAITATFEPYAELNLRDVSVELAIPLAYFYYQGAGRSDFALGNISLDAKFGRSYGKVIGLGWSAGVEASLPTAMNRASGVALSNIFAAPRYLGRYLTLAPYGVVGVDALIVNLQAYAKLADMIGVRGEAGNSLYLQYGAALAVAPFRFLNLIAEVNGLQDVSNAPAFSGQYLTAGFKMQLLVLRWGLAAHVPLSREKDDTYGAMAATPFGSPADWSVVTTFAIDL
jgi:hypothetical protein